MSNMKALNSHVKYESPKSYQSNNIANVKVFADKQTDARTNRQTKSICPQFINAGKGGLDKMKGFADNKFNVAQILASFFVGIENTVRKSENAGYHFFYNRQL